jgi:GT2 family glycosyltransferase
MPAPKVVLLILTWNRRDDVVRCVASLSRLTYPNYLAVVIDNASRDDTVATLRQRFPRLTVLVNETNLGYAGGNNVGIRWALAHAAQYVLVMNNDTEVTPHMVSTMVEVAEGDPRIAVVGCRNVLMEDPTRLWGAYGELTYGPFVVRSIGQNAADGPEWQTVKDVDWVIGNGFLWRAAALERIGMLDERFFGYHEDVDWCVRARRAGYRVVYAGSAAIVHKGASSSDPRQARRFPVYYFLGRNGVLFVRKHGGPSDCLRFAITCGGAWAFRGLRALTLSVASRRARRVGRAAQLRAMEGAFIRGVTDALRGRPIPFHALDLSDALPAREPRDETSPAMAKPLKADAMTPPRR